MDQPSSPAAAAVPRWEAGLHLGVFILVMLAQLAALSLRWGSGNLAGNEFRQAQTALSAHFIQKEQGWALDYPTPVLGRPWSIPLEFPLYQWTVVSLSNTTGLPLVQAGRTVSAVCLYLTLPAVWLLLGWCGLPGPRRWLVLALVLSCPLFVFYGRAFLIETMALMFSLWFLAAFVETVRRRSLPWLVVAGVLGAAGGAVKVTTFLVYTLPAAVYGGVLLVRAWRTRDARWPEIARTLGWGLGCVVVPFGATLAWLHHADSVKALNPAAAFLVSGDLAPFNFGYGAFAVRFSPDAWMAMAGFWHRGLMALPLAGVLFGQAMVTGGRWRWPIAASLGLFLAAQIVFPVLFSVHDYYSVAIAALPMAAAGLALVGLFEARPLRWVGVAAALFVLAVQARTYCTGFLRELGGEGDGGTGLSQLLHDITLPSDVLVIAGADWNSAMPFYARRRALMLRHGTEKDWARIGPAFAQLRDEVVGALLLRGDQRDNAALLSRVVETFGVNPLPALTYRDTAVYLHPSVQAKASASQRSVPYEGVVWNPLPLPTAADTIPAGRELDMAELPAAQQRILRPLRLAPHRFFFEFAPRTVVVDDEECLLAHPAARLRFRVPAGRRHLRIGFGIAAEAYAQPTASTDGVELSVGWAAADGSVRTLATRGIRPATEPRDRGPQQLNLTLDLPPGAELIVSVGPGPAGNFAYDWFYLSGLSIR